MRKGPVSNTGSYTYTNPIEMMGFVSSLKRHNYAVFLLCSDLLGEGSHGSGFIVLDVKDGVELGDLQQVVHLLGQL